MNGFIEQSGVIAYRFRRGRLEIALVTAGSGPHWTIPKGHIEPNMSAADSAAKEALEEAGVIGDADSQCVGSYRYEKRGRQRRVRVYLMAVRRELRIWPECAKRRRCWVSAEDAADRVRSVELRHCILRVQRMLERRHLSVAA